MLARRTPFLIASSSVLFTAYVAAPTLFPRFNIGSAFSSSAMSADPTSFPKGKSEAEWQTQLTSEQFRVIRKKGTEPAGSGEYDSHYPDKGVYECAGCGTPLYTADTKFKSGCGWPAFFDAIPGAVTQHPDTTFGMTRIEITCTACGGHLGHLFKNEGFSTPTNERACVNSVSVRYNAEGEGKYEGKK